MRALITGIGGFVGGHLTTLLREEGFEVWGIDRAPVSADVANHAAAIELGDISDSAFMDRVVRGARPTYVFHLAATFSQNDSSQSRATDGNVLSASMLLKAIGASAGEARVMIASSSAVYGASGRQPIAEDAPLKPTSAYGISKAAMERVADSFRRACGMNVVVTRTFNLLGPGIPSRLFAGSVAAQIAAAERGGSPTIKVGRLDSSRDYIDVRDAARAYLALASQPVDRQWVFNVCGGVSHSCRELADKMMTLAKVPVMLEHDASRLQTSDIDYQRGSAARLQRTTGWTPTITFSRSVHDTLEHARNHAD